MNSKKTYPNPFWYLLYIFIFIPFPVITYFLVRIILNEGIYVMFIFVSLLITFTIYFYTQLSNFLTFISINNSKIKIYQLLKFKIHIFEIDEISGYSLSEFYFGRNPSFFTSKSFVIYSKKNKPLEIIKMFNLNYLEVLSEIKKKNIIKFGFEPYVTSLLYRKYKYGYLIR